MQTLQGRVTGIWGTAMIRGADGKMRALKLGELVERGDVILTSQNGLVQLSPEDSVTTREVLAKKPVAPQPDVDRVIGALNDPNGQDATAAGLNGGDGGELSPMLRVDRITEGVTSASLTLPTFDAPKHVEPVTGGQIEPLNQPQTPIGADSTTIDAIERGPAVGLGLTPPTGTSGAAVITITQVPAVGQLQKADGTAISAGTVISVSDLTGLKYVPPTDYNGRDPVGAISYTVSDHGSSASGTVSIDLTPVNDAPVANADTGSGAEDTPITGNVLTNDTDPDSPTLTVTQYTIAGVTHPAGSTTTLVGIGNIVINADGSYTFTPAPDYNGPVPAIGYTVSDGSLTSTSTLTLTVNAVNDAPDAVDDLASTPVNTAIAIAVLANDHDRDGDPLTVTGATLANPAQGSVTINPDGTLAYTPATNVSGPVTISYTISDGHGGTDTATVTVNVGANTPPNGTDATVSIAEDTSKTFAAGDFGFSDADAGQTLANVRIDTLPGAGTLTLNGSPVVAGQVIAAANLGALVYTPAANANGNAYAAFTFSVQDSAGAFDTAPNTITVNVTPVNDPPLAANDSGSGLEDVPQSGNVLANDSDIDGDALSVTQVTIGGTTVAAGTPATLPGIGTLLINADGSYTYTPAANYNGPVPVATYTMTDGSVTQTATLTLSVTPVNDAPVAGDDLASTPINTPTTIAVLANDTDADGDPLTVSNPVLADPTRGAVVLNPDGTLTFTPASNISGPVTITYTVSDGHGGADTATVTVNVGANTPPDSADKTVTTNEDTARPFTLADFTFTDADAGQTLANVRIDTLPGAGTLTLNGSPIATGALVSQADIVAGHLVYTPAANANGTGYAAFTFSVQDSAGAFDTAPNTITVNVTPQPDAAVISGVASGATVEDTTLVAAGKLNVVDPDAGEASFQTQTNVAGAHGTFSIDAAGNWTYNLNNADTAVQALGAGQSLPNETFTVKSIDGTSTTVTVSIAGTNDAPIAQASSFTVAEDAPVVSGNVSASDADTGAVLGFALNNPAPAGLVFNANGSYTFDPSNAAYQSLGVGQTRVIVVPYTVTDEHGATDSKNLTITVTGTNDTPVAVADAASLSEDATLAVPAATGVLVNDTDTDTGDALSVASVAFNGTTVAAGAPLVGAYGTLTLNADGSYGYTPNTTTAQALLPGQSASEVFTYTVSDGHGGTASATLTITINGANDAPVIGGAVSGTTTEDVTLTTSGQLTITDPDAGQSAFQPLSNVAGTYGTFSVDASGAWHYDLANGQANVQALAQGASVTEIPFTVTSIDGTTRNIVITVNGTNDAPVAQAASFAVAEDAPIVSGNVTASDVDAGAVLSYALNNPAPAGLVFNANGSYTFDPSNAAYQSLGVGQTRVIVVPYTVTDEHGATDSKNLTITVTGTDDAPVISAGVGAVTENTAPSASGTLTATDVDNPALAFVAATIGGSYGSLVLQANGQWTYTLDARAEPLAQGQVVSEPITVHLNDGSTSTVTITVTGTNDAAVITGAATGSVTEDATLFASGKLNATDIDSPATFAPQSLTLTYGNFSIDAAGNWSYTLRNGDANVQALTSAQHPTETITVATADGTTQQITITVNGANEIPTATVTPASGAEDAVGIPITLAGSDVDGTIAGFTVTALPANGTLLYAGNPVTLGQIIPALANAAGLSFVPAANWNGSTSLSFSAIDNEGAASAPVSQPITVTAVNDAPVAANDAFTTNEDTPVVVHVLDNDSDVDGDALSITQINGTSIAVNGTVAVTGGTVTLNADKTLTFNPNLNYNGSPSFTYTIDDGHGGTASATVNGTVTPVNDAPTLDLDADNSHNAVTTQPIAGLYNTGVDNGGLALPIGSADPHYALIAAPAGSGATNQTRTPSIYTVANDADSTWLGSNGNEPGGDYQYQTSFTLQAGADPRTVQIGFDLAGDDTVRDILVNGVSTGIHGSLSYAALTHLVLDGATAAFHAGANTITFVINNDQGNNVGLRVDNMTGTVNVAGSDVVGHQSDYATSFVDGTPVAIADADTLITDTDSATMQSAVITLTNAQAGDVLLAGAMPAGITATASAGGTIITLAGAASLAAYQSAIQAIQFNNTAHTQSDADRTITVTVNDGGLSSNVATTTVHVVPVNATPVATNDVGSGNEDTVLTGNVLTNDVDPEGHPLTVTFFTIAGDDAIYQAHVNDAVIPGIGTLFIDPNGHYGFTPVADYYGPVPVVTYTVTDGSKVTTGTLTLSVTPVADVVADTVATPEDTPIVFNPITGLNDVGGGDNFENAAATLTAVSTPAHGSVTYAADGTITYTPNANYNGPDTFTYTVTSGGVTETATINVNVAAVNDVPVAGNDVASTAINTPINNIIVLANDQDADGDTLGVTGATLANPALGTVTINPDGTLNFAPATNVTGPVAINYTISDGHGGTASAVLTVNVGANTPPDSADKTVTTNEDTARPFTLADFTFTDADAGQTLANVRIDTLPGAGTLNLNGSPIAVGALVSQADIVAGHLVYTPAANANGTGYAAFTFSVQDSAGAFDTAPNTITVNVAPQPDAAVISGVASGATVEDTTLVAAGKLNVVDPDAGEAAFQTQTNVAGAHGTFSIDAAGNWTYNLNNADTAVQALGAGQSLPNETFTVKSIDGTSAQVIVSITGTDDAPVISSGTGLVTENTLPSTSGTLTATDVDNPALAFVAATIGGSYGSLVLQANGQWTYTLDARAEPLAQGQVVSEPITVHLNDGSTSTVTITVTGTNDAAVITGAATGSVTEDATLFASGKLNATDIDSPATFAPQSLTLTYGNFSIDAAGNWSYTLRNGDANVQALTSAQHPTETVTVATADGTTQQITITVNGANEIPTATVTPASGAEDAVGIPITLAGSDVDGTIAGFTVTALPANGTLLYAGNPVTLGQIIPALANAAGLSFVPAANWNGSTSLSFSAIDNEGAASAPVSQPITVTAVNDAPVATNDAATTPINTTISNIVVLANDKDVDGDTLTVTAATLANPALGVVSINTNGTLNFTPATNVSGPVAIDYTISDGHGGTASAVLTVNVGANTPPAGADASVTMLEDGSRAFTPADFSFTDADAGQTLAAVRIDTLPANGTLTLSGNPIAAGAVVAVADLANLVYTPAANGNGAAYASFTFSVQDSGGAFDTAPNTLTVNVTPVNDAPAGTNATLTTAEDTGVVLHRGDFGYADAADAPANGFASVLINPPSVGSLTLGGVAITAATTVTVAQLDANQLVYTPPSNANGNALATLTFQVRDDGGTANGGADTDSTPNTLTFNVTAQPDAAVISGVANGATVEDTTLVATGKLNVVDPDAGEAAFQTQTNVAGAHGTFSIDAAGNWTYNLNNADTAVQALGAGQSLPNETFTVKSIDGTSTTVTVSIAGTNDAPIAQASSFTVAEDAPVVSGNVSASDADTGAVLGFALNNPAPAGLVFNANGSYTFDPSNAAYQSLGVGQTRVIVVPYTVTDEHGATDSKNLTITVTGTDDAPVISAGVGAVTENTAPSASGTLTATDVDNPALAFVAATIGGSYGSLVLQANGQWTYTLDARAEPLAQGQVVSEPITVHLNDGSTSTVTITVTGTNDAAVITGAATGSVTEDATLFASGKLNATDIDSPATFAPQSLTLTYGNFSVDAAGNWSYTLRNGDANVQALTSAQHPTETVTVATADGTTQQITITVNGANETPTATVTPASGAEDAVGIPITLAGSDVDGTIAGFTVTALPANGTLLYAGNPVTLGQIIPASGNAAGLTFVPSANWNGTTNLSFTASDNEGATSAPATQSITVTAVNDNPVANNDAATTPINTAVNNIVVLGNDTDVDGDTLSVTSATLANPALGTVSINPNGTLNFTPAGNITGPVAINYTINDGHGGTASAVLTVNVGANTPPDSADKTVTTNEDTARPFTLADFTFTDADAGQTLANVRIDTLPGAGTLTLNGNPIAAGALVSQADIVAGHLVYTPAANANGTGYAAFTFSVQDSAGAFDTAPNTITVNVTPQPDAAVISGVASGATVEDTTLVATGKLNVVDPDAGEAAFQPQTNIAGAHGTFSIDAAGNWNYTLNNLDPAVQALGQGQTLPNEVFAVKSVDGTTANVTVSIVGTNDPAVITPAVVNLTETNAVLTTGGTLPVTDVDSPATFVAQSNVSGSNGYGNFTLGTNGVWTYTTTTAHNEFVAGQTYTDALTVMSADGTTSTITVNILGTNDAAVITPAVVNLTETNAILTTGGTLAITDVDSSATFVAQSNVLGSNGYGSFTLSTNGVWTYTTTTAHNEFVAGQTYTDTLTVTSADGTTSTITVNILGTNDAAVVTPAVVNLTETSAILTTGGTLAITDVDSPATFVAQSNVSGSNGYGNFTLGTNGVWTYTTTTAHNEFVAGQTYTDTLTVTSADGTTSTITVNILGTNDAAVITPAVVNLTETNAVLTTGGTLPITDVDSPATFVAQSNVPGSNGYGNFTLGANGAWTYTTTTAHNEFVAGQTYTDTLTVTSADGTTSTITVNILGTNDAAVITPAVVNLTETNAVLTTGGTLPITDVDSPATFVAQSNVLGSNGYGNFTLGANGAWTYTTTTAHNEFVAGTTYTDTLTVTSADGTTSTITVNILGTNDAAVITPAVVNLTETNAVLTTGGTLPITDVDSPATFVAQSNVPGSNGYGNFTLGTNGAWTYTTTTAHNEFVAGQTYTDTLTVTSADGTTSTITVNILGTNDAAVITPAVVNLTETNAVLTTGGTLAITDVDSPATFVAQSNVPGSNGYGNFTLSTNGVWTYTTTTAHNEFVAGQTYTDTLTVTSADGTTSTITVNILGTNDAAVITPAVVNLTETNAVLTTGGTLPITDVDSPATFVAQSNAPGSNGYGNFTLGTNGVWTYTTTTAHNEFVAGQTYIDTLTVTSADGTTSTITVNILGTNDAAVITPAVVNLTETNAVLTTGGTLPITDVDSPATFVAQSNVPGSNGYGNFTLGANGVWTYTTTTAHNEFVAGQTYTDTLTVTSADGTTSTITVNILGTNDAAVITPAVVNLTETNAVLTTGGTLPITDVDSPATFVAQSNVLGSNGYGNFTLGTNGVWTYTTTTAHNEFAAGQTYTDTLTVTSADGTTSTITVNILGTNDAAVITPAVVNLTETNAVLTTGGTLPITDVDSPATFVAQSNVPGSNGYGNFTLGTNGAWTYTTTTAHNEFVAGQTYTDTLTVTSADGTTSTITVNILGTNDAPVVVNDSATTLEDTPVSGNVLTNDSDAEGSALSVTQFVIGGNTYAAGATANLAGVGSLVVSANGNYTFTPFLNYGGPVPSATVTVSDGSATTTSALAITLTPVADTPSVTVSSAFPGVTVFSNGWETAANSNTTSETIYTTTFEGWTIVTTPDPTPTGIDPNGFEIWNKADQVTMASGAIHNGFNVAAGGGNQVLELNDTNGSGLIQTLGITRSVNTVAGQVYDFSFDYAGRFGFNSTYTQLKVTINGVAVDFSDTSNETTLDWHKLHFAFNGTGGPVVIEIRTDNVATDVGGRGAFIDNLLLTTQQGIVSGNAVSGTKTDIGLGSYITNAALADTDGSEALTVKLSNIPSGAQILVGGSPVTITGNSVTLTTAELAGAVLRLDSSVTGDVTMDVNAVATETSNGSIAQSATQTLHLQVLAAVVNDLGTVDQAPVAVNDGPYTTAEDTKFTVSTATLLANDTDPDDVQASLAIASVGNAVNGTVALVGGNVEFTPSANFVGTGTFQYTLIDPSGSFSVATVTVNVTPVNDAPAGTNKTVSGTEDVTVTLAASDFGFTDPNDTPANTLLSVTVNKPSTGTLQLNGATINAATVVTLAQLNAGQLKYIPVTNANGNVGTFTFQVRDNGGTANGGVDTDQSPNTITFNLAPVNDAPTAVADTTVAVEAGGVGNGTAGTNPTGNVLTNDTDPDLGNGDVLSVASVRFGATVGTVGAALTGTYGSLVLNADGSYTYTVDNTNATVQGLRTAANTLTEVFSYTTRDAAGLTSGTVNLTVTIQGANDTPVGVNDTGAVNENSTLTVTAANGVLTNDTDVDTGDTKTVSAVAFGATAGTVGAALVGTYGTLTLSANGSYTYAANTAGANALGVGQTGIDTFTYTVRDTAGATSTATLRLTVTGINDAPIAVADTATAVEAGGNANGTAGVNPSGNVLTNDTDVDIGDTKAVSAITGGTLGVAKAGTYGSLVLNADGSYTYTVDNSNATVQALGSSANTLTDTFSYTMRDAAGATSGPVNLVVTIQGANDAPTNTVAAGYATNEDTAVKLTGLAVSDIDAGTTPMTVTLAAASGTLTAINGGSVTVGGSGTGTLTLTGTLTNLNNYLAAAASQPTYTPAANAHGTVALTMTTSDNNASGALTDVDTVNITVNAVADVPTLALPAATLKTFTEDWQDGNPSAGTLIWTGTPNVEATNAQNSYTTTQNPHTALTPATNIVGEVEGNNFAGTSTLSTSMTFANAGQVVDISLDTIVRTAGTGGQSAADIAQQSFNVVWNGAVLGTATPAAGWTTPHFEAVSVAGTNTLSFVALDTSTPTHSVGGIIDNLSIQAVADAQVNGTAKLASLAGLATFGDTADNSETHTLSLNTIPVGATLSDGTHSFTATAGNTTAILYNEDVPGDATGGSNWDLANLSLTGPSGFMGDAVMQVTATATEASNGSTSSVSQSLVATFAPLTIVNGTLGNDTMLVADAPNHVFGLDGNDSISAAGTSANHWIDGGIGNDTLVGGSGNDLIVGGKGNDTLTGGGGADVFKWSLADQGTTAAKATDTISDFDNSAGGDKLDLRDLLSGEHALGASNLTNYLHFTVASGTTTISISSSGAFNGSNYGTATDQSIVLTGVNLVGALANDAAVIADLLARQKVVVDS